jgi:hypothetical protein
MPTFEKEHLLDSPVERFTGRSFKEIEENVTI